MGSDIIAVNVRNAVEKTKNLSPNSLNGNLQDTRKNPHVIYVGLKNHTIVN
jgi:hypothetical protein